MILANHYYYYVIIIIIDLLKRKTRAPIIYNKNIKTVKRCHSVSLKMIKI